MPANKILLSRIAGKNLSKLPLSIHKRVINALGIIKENPLAGPKLKGELFGTRKYRIGDYRIVYEFDTKSKTVSVHKVERRGGVYR